MTEEKQKAIELYEAFRSGHYLNPSAATYCAIISVSIIKKELQDNTYEKLDLSFWNRVERELKLFKN